MEIITGVERRRRWREDEKLGIVAEAELAGACISEVARRHDLSRGLLWNWRRQVRNGTLVSTTGVQFLPVQVMAEEAAAVSPHADKRLSSRRLPGVADATIEIVLPNGTTVRVGRDVGAAALRRVLSVLRG